MLATEKRVLNGLPHYLTNIANSELDHIGENFTECNCMYMPQVRGQASTLTLMRFILDISIR